MLQAASVARWTRCRMGADGAAAVVNADGRAFDVPNCCTTSTTCWNLLAHGTGLGLAMVQRVMHRMDGDVSVESAEGVGTTVHLLVPAAPHDA